jgi:hypothetical protein
MNGSVAGFWWYEQTARVITKFNLNIIKLCEITTREAPAKIGIKNSFTALITEEAEQYKGRILEVLKCHCIMHKQFHCSQTIPIIHLVSTPMSRVIFIQSRSLSHRQFQVLTDLEDHKMCTATQRNDSKEDQYLGSEPI